MVDLFSVTAPLVIRSPYGGEKIIAELFSHPEGIIFFEIFWNQLEKNNGVFVIKGEIKGEGPWKIGEYVINILGCHGTNAELAEDFAQWQVFRQSAYCDYPQTEEITKIAQRYMTH